MINQVINKYLIFFKRMKGLFFKTENGIDKLKSIVNNSNNMNTNKSLYLTELNLPAEGIYQNHEITINQDKAVNKSPVSSYLIKNQKTFKNVKLNAVDYMLHEETHYTDFKKISEFLETVQLENFKIYNNNENEIKKKKKLLEDLEMQVSEVKYLLRLFYILIFQT